MFHIYTNSMYHLRARLAWQSAIAFQRPRSCEDRIHDKLGAYHVRNARKSEIRVDSQLDWLTRPEQTAPLNVLEHSSTTAYAHRLTSSELSRDKACCPREASHCPDTCMLIWSPLGRSFLMAQEATRAMRAHVPSTYSRGHLDAKLMCTSGGVPAVPPLPAGAVTCTSRGACSSAFCCAIDCSNIQTHTRTFWWYRFSRWKARPHSKRLLALLAGV